MIFTIVVKPMEARRGRVMFVLSGRSDAIRIISPLLVLCSLVSDVLFEVRRVLVVLGLLSFPTLLFLMFLIRPQ